MPIIFISLNDTFTELARMNGFEAHTMRIQDYKQRNNVHTYYVSPANSLCFTDGGIDYALSRIVFPNIEPIVKQNMKSLGITNLIGRPYLPIGSSMVIPYDEQKSLIVAPTMLLPQDVSNTQNAYYATMAVLYNILVHKNESLADVDILFTSLCCGYGKMSDEKSFQQILTGIQDYSTYKPQMTTSFAIVNEPNLLEQPKFYQNTEWFSIHPGQIERAR